ncbi:3-hydroxyacyl-CoA dehydrogenase [Shimia gijangensis]|uniref:3-hydroxyacyl-CoA dehydrogenase n=1 Tax=Shimia gijangensis TaxID=1470563 RepID=A0A1M6E2G2_9RHOB|nr:3-hydroxyacyl-CoA dehydrogenase NAD-binding domain-containing protein [Shimia gijangensis]SHI79692.1 3-hydroxyacyl-CoA dehydrogenase [Shimia gijangensis]
MTQTVLYEVEDGIAILSVNNPPANTLTATVRAGLVERLDQASDDPEVKAIILRGHQRTFPSEIDIKQIGHAEAGPELSEVCDRIEAATKPVIAVIHGAALSGGFELALAAHYRVANRGAWFGLPDVTLGLVPGAGGTQRAPRLLGADLALNLMVPGKAMSANAPEAARFLDEVFKGDLWTGAKHFVQNLIARGTGPRPTQEIRTGFQDVAAYQAAIASHRKAISTAPEEAPQEILRCVEAAILLPFEQGLAFERSAFEQCVASDQSAALRHVYFSERRAAKFQELRTGRVRDLRKIGIVGGGERGCSLAEGCLEAGFEVVLAEKDDAALEKATARINTHFSQAEDVGQISSRARQSQSGRLSGTLEFQDLSECDLVFEAVPDDLARKLAVFGRLDGVVKEGAILVTTTANPDLARIADETGAPADVLGMHFYTSVKDSRLVEIVAGPETSADAVATGVILAKRLRKTPIKAGLVDGFVGQRLMAAYRFAADLMLEQGATPYIVDEAMKSYGMALGPYRQLDYEGLDVSWARRQRLAVAGGPAGDHVAVGDVLCNAGRLGRKVGKGYYRYDSPTQHGDNDPDVIDLIRGERDRKGIRARRVLAKEIQRCCLAALVNEGARLLREGVAVSPSDIDMVMIQGCGFPRWRGGPMMAADQAGLLDLQNDLRDYAQQDAWFWTPEPVLEDLIKNGRRFSDLND